MRFMVKVPPLPSLTMKELPSSWRRRAAALASALSEAFFMSSSLMNIWHTIQAANRTPIDIHMNAWLNS